MTEDDQTTAPGEADLRCAECGERIRRGRTPGTFTHTARLVAACDLDSDHAAVPAAGATPSGPAGAEGSAQGSAPDGGLPGHGADDLSRRRA